LNGIPVPATAAPMGPQSASRGVVHLPVGIYLATDERLRQAAWRELQLATASAVERQFAAEGAGKSREATDGVKLAVNSDPARYSTGILDHEALRLDLISPEMRDLRVSLWPA
jgi:hypothetical protein